MHWSFFGMFTPGGLAIRASTEVLTPEHEGRGYASRLSIGEATFFGRVAGRNAAALALLE